MSKDRGARYASAAELLPVIRSIGTRPENDGRRTLARRSALAAMIAGGLAIVRSAGTGSETKLRTPDRVISVGKRPYSITAGGGWIWTANNDGNSVTRIDAATGTVTGTFPAGEMASVVVWDGEVIWVANHKWLTGEYSTLMKLDPNDGRILDTFRLPGQPIHLMVEGPHIWVTETWPTYMVRKLRRGDGKEMGAYTAGGIPRQAVTDGESVWVTNGAIGSVTRIRASDGKIMVARAIEGAPNFVRRAGGHIWVANNRTESEKEAIFKLTPDDLKVVGQFPTPFSWTGTITDRWFFNAAPGWVSQRRLKDGSEAGRWAVGREPVSIIHDGTNHWVADFTESSVTMISARSLEDADRSAKRA
jgi:hypothetical protein